jgi:hypothetical protein
LGIAIHAHAGEEIAHAIFAFDVGEVGVAPQRKRDVFFDGH